MGWFDDERTKREKEYLEKYKKKPYSRKVKKSVKTAAKRQREYEKLQTKTDVYRDELRVKKAKAELERKKLQAKGKLPLTTGKKGRKTAPKKKIGFFSPYVFGKKIKKKKQGRPLSRKRPIRLL